MTVYGHLDLGQIEAPVRTSGALEGQFNKMYISYQSLKLGWKQLI